MKNLRRSTIIGLTALAALRVASSAFAYGHEGHKTVGAIADELIQGTPAETKVKALLPDMTLSEAATWADRAKGTQGPLTKERKDFVAANPDQPTYHFTVVPYE